MSSELTQISLVTFQALPQVTFQTLQVSNSHATLSMWESVILAPFKNIPSNASSVASGHISNVVLF